MIAWSHPHLMQWHQEDAERTLIITQQGSMANAVRDKVKDAELLEWSVNFAHRGAINLPRILGVPDQVMQKELTLFLTAAPPNALPATAPITILPLQNQPAAGQHILQMLSNANSLHFLDSALLCHMDAVDRSIDTFHTWLQEKQIAPDDCCLDSSIVLMLYGIRPARDVDFIHKDRHIHADSNKIGCHNKLVAEMQYTSGFDHACFELVTNPINFFYYRGLKFMSLALTREMKDKRLMLGVRSKKDMLDVWLIDQHLSAIEAGRQPIVRGLTLRRGITKLLDFPFNAKLLQHKLLKGMGKH